MNDDELHDLIRQTHPKPEFHSSFQREIWARISVAEQMPWSARYRRWVDSFFRSMAEPAPALALVMMLLLLGAGLGRLVSPENDADALRAAYVASISPVAAAHLTNGE